MIENETVGWHHQLSGHEFEQTLRDREGSLACCSPWGHKESDTTERLNNKLNSVNCMFQGSLILVSLCPECAFHSVDP